MVTFDLRPWLTCVDTTFGGDEDARRRMIDVTDLDVHDDDHRAVLIRAQHPMLAAAIDDDVEELVVRGEPMNPRLHLLMHEIVANQLADGEPAAVRGTVRRLEREGHDRHEILHMIAGGVSQQLWSALDGGSPADLDAYVAYLDGLPASWYGTDDDAAAELPDDGFDILGTPEDDEGPADALVRAMLGDGVDLSDQAAVGAWIEDFNAGPAADRDRVLGPALGDVALPPVALPDDATLARSALATPAMTQLVRFVTWLGDRRSLTQRGNLTLADGKHLVELLGTGDRYDETIRGRQYRTQSTTRLLGVDLVHRLALASGLTRRQGSSLRRASAGAELAAAAARSRAAATSADAQQEPNGHGDEAAAVDADDAAVVLERYRTVVHEMLDLGLVAGGRDDRYGLRWWADTLDDGVVDLLASMLLAGAPMAVDLLADDALEQLAEDYALDRLSERAREALPASVAWGMGQVADRLVWLGLVTRNDVRVEPDILDQERRVGGLLALTPLGVWFVRPLLVAQGFDVPLAGALADADADALLDAVADWAPQAFDAEVERWITGRPTAADELADAARTAADLDRVGLAFAALDVVGADAEPAVRGLADDPLHRPFVIAWLRDHGLDPLPAEPSDPRLELVRQVASVLVTIAPEAGTEAALADRADAALVEQLWRVDDPWTTPVLEALGAAPDKRLAKAARRALFKRRNRN
jgi:hypothetical protein